LEAARGGDPREKEIHRRRGGGGDPEVEGEIHKNRRTREEDPQEERRRTRSRSGEGDPQGQVINPSPVIFIFVGGEDFIWNIVLHSGYVVLLLNVFTVVGILIWKIRWPGPPNVLWASLDVLVNHPNKQALPLPSYKKICLQIVS
jgi:hypothetical protein